MTSALSIPMKTVKMCIRDRHSTRELLTRAREWLDTIEDEPDDEDY